MLEKGDVAIDGPAGCGKTAVSRKLAEKLTDFYGVRYTALDTGVFYRALTFALIKAGFGRETHLDRIMTLVNSGIVRFEANHVIHPYFEGDLLQEKQLNSDAVNDAVPFFAGLVDVRKVVKIKEQEFVRDINFVAAGRDSAVVFAYREPLGIFMDTPFTRCVELRAAGRFGSRPTSEELRETELSLIRRNAADITREISPLSRYLRRDIYTCTIFNTGTLEETVTECTGIYKKWIQERKK